MGLLRQSVAFRGFVASRKNRGIRLPAALSQESDAHEVDVVSVAGKARVESPRLLSLLSPRVRDGRGGQGRGGGRRQMDGGVEPAKFAGRLCSHGGHMQREMSK